MLHDTRASPVNDKSEVVLYRPDSINSLTKGPAQPSSYVKPSAKILVKPNQCSVVSNIKYSKKNTNIYIYIYIYIYIHIYKYFYKKVLLTYPLGKKLTNLLSGDESDKVHSTLPGSLNITCFLEEVSGFLINRPS